MLLIYVFTTEEVFRMLIKYENGLSDCITDVAEQGTGTLSV